MAGKVKRAGRPGYKAMYARYETKNSASKNRKLKLERHCKAHPNDEQASKALPMIANKPYKKAPKSSMYPKAVFKELPDGKREVAYYSRSEWMVHTKMNKARKAMASNPTYWMSKEQKAELAERKRLFGKDGFMDADIAKELVDKFKKKK